MAVPQRRPGFLSPAYLIRSRAISKGVFGGSRGWQIIAGLIFTRQALKRIFGRTAETLINEPLKPGESMTITTIPVGKRSRRSRRAS